MKLSELSRKQIIFIISALVVLFVAIIALLFLIRNRSKDDTDTLSMKEIEKIVSDAEDIVFDKAGTYKSSDVYKSGTIKSSGVSLDGLSFETLEITADVGEGVVYLDNVTVTDTLTIRGGGRVYFDIGNDGLGKVSDSYVGCRIATIIVEDQNTQVDLGSTQIDKMTVTDVNLVDIKGSVKSLTIDAASRENTQTYYGIYVWPNASISDVQMNAQAYIFASNNTVKNLTVADGLDDRVYPYPGEGDITDRRVRSRNGESTAVISPVSFVGSNGLEVFRYEIAQIIASNQAPEQVEDDEEDTNSTTTTPSGGNTTPSQPVDPGVTEEADSTENPELPQEPGPVLPDPEPFQPEPGPNDDNP